MKLSLLPALSLLGATMASIPTLPTAVLFENNEVKVSRALEKAHVAGKFHEHTMNRLMVYLGSGRQRFEYQDGRQPEVFDWKAGEVKWSPASGMHKPEVLDHDFNIIETELKTPGTNQAITDKLDPLKVDPGQYKLELENPQVRVLRITIGPHALVPMHAYSTDRVTIFLTDQHFKIKDSSGKVETVDHKAGDVVWETPTTRAEQNLTDQPFEAVTVQIKK